MNWSNSIRRRSRQLQSASSAEFYLDHAATRWPRPQAVITAVADATAAPFGNPGRGAHAWALEAGQALYDARATIAAYFGVDPLRVILGSSGTDVLNTLIQGLPAGYTIGTTTVEHNSVRRPLHHKEQNGDCTLKYCPVNEAGRLITDQLPQCDVYLVTGASNVLGGMQDFKSLRAAAGDALILIDGAQIVGECDPQEYMPYIDGIAAPGHKALGGPMGTGLLWCNDKVVLEPSRFGGTGMNSESADQSASWPDGFEAGTANVPAIIGLAQAVITASPTAFDGAHAAAQLLRDEFASNASFTVVGALQQPAAPVVSFRHRHIDDQTLGMLLAERGWAVRAGLHCAPGAHYVDNGQDHSGTGAVRVSFGPEHSVETAQKFIVALQEILAENYSDG